MDNRNGILQKNKPLNNIIFLKKYSTIAIHKINSSETIVFTGVSEDRILLNCFLIDRPAFYFIPKTVFI